MAEEELPLDQLFVRRAACAGVSVGEADAEVGSRVGGRAPALLEEQAPACPRCGGGLEYVWTLEDDVLTPGVAGGQALSLLCCRDLGCRMASHAIVTPSSLVLCVHATSPRAAAPGALDSTFEGRRLLRGPAEPDHQEDLSKLGGAPWYLQGDDDGEGEAQAQRGNGFLLQWSENSYRCDMSRGTYPFCFGVVYLFSRLDPATGLPLLAELAGFWQNS